jgi:KUP system potassium uptake protein
MQHILGVVSLVLWSLILLICVKYLIFILRADNKGEGGVLSLMALASHGMSETSKRRVGDRAAGPVWCRVAVW